MKTEGSGGISQRNLELSATWKIVVGFTPGLLYIEWEAG
jgi:hypothetical protein